MASFLGDSLSKSHKPQERTAAKARTPKSNFSRSMLSSMSTLANSKSGDVKFWERTQQLRTINSIRKAPVGAQIKRVIDLLLEKRQALTPEEINISFHVDVNGNQPVFDRLRKNPKVSYDGERFCYKSKYRLGNKGDLLKLIKNFPEGIAVIDLEDAYTAVMDDLQALKGLGEVWLISNPQEDIAYPNDTKSTIRVDHDLKQLFRVIELPRDMVDIEADLQNNGIKPATNTRKRKAGEIHAIAPRPKAMKKQHKISKRIKLTNFHLPELFEHLSMPRS